MAPTNPIDLGRCVSCRWWCGHSYPLKPENGWCENVSVNDAHDPRGIRLDHTFCPNAHFGCVHWSGRA